MHAHGKANTQTHRVDPALAMLSRVKGYSRDPRLPAPADSRRRVRYGSCCVYTESTPCTVRETTKHNNEKGKKK